LVNVKISIETETQDTSDTIKSWLIILKASSFHYRLFNTIYFSA